jgi:hypothetical protein
MGSVLDIWFYALFSQRFHGPLIDEHQELLMVSVVEGVNGFWLTSIFTGCRTGFILAFDA